MLHRLLGEDRNRRRESLTLSREETPSVSGTRPLSPDSGATERGDDVATAGKSL